MANVSLGTDQDSDYKLGSVSISGLVGDTDFTAMLDKLQKVEQKRGERLLKWRKDWQTRVDAFSEIRTELMNLQTSLKKINTVDSFLTKSVTSSNSNVATAKASGSSTSGSYKLEVKQIATASTISKNTGITDKLNASITDNADGSFTYTFKGVDHTISVPKNTSLEGLKNLINNSSDNPGINASLMQSSSGWILQMKSKETGADHDLAVKDVSNIPALSATNSWVDASVILNNGASAVPAKALDKTYSNYNEVINSTESNQEFNFSVGNQNYTISVPPGTTLAGLESLVNAADPNNSTFTAGVFGTNGSYFFAVAPTNSADTVTIDPSSTLTSFSPWQVSQGQNAKIRLDDYPADGWIEVSSNSVSDLVDGMTFNLSSAGGPITLKTEVDSKKVTENVEEFVKSINTLRKKFQELTAVDTKKSLSDLKVADSQFEMEMGSVLTGNYGVQLMSSKLKNAVASSALGFMAPSVSGGLGQIFTSLSQIGITTNSDQGSDNYGMLEIRKKDTSGTTDKDNPLSFEEALEKDAEAVAELFSTTVNGIAYSKNLTGNCPISYSGAVDGITKPGKYDVQYTINAQGDLDPNSCTINGKAASYDAASRKLTSVDYSDDAAGIVVTVEDFSVGSHAADVCLQQGKINELLSIIQGDGTSKRAGILDTDVGSLSILENNYKAIIKNVDKKILEEDTRVAAWRKKMQAQFARLEKNIAKYDKINSAVAAQIKQLGSS